MAYSSAYIARNKEIALTHIHDGIGRQDMSAFAHFREDARFWQNGRHLELAGYHSMVEMVGLAAKAMAKFPNGMAFDILTVTAEENRVLVEATSDAQLANGTRYENQYVFSFYFDENNKIIEFREFWDPLYAFETMFDGEYTLQ